MASKSSQSKKSTQRKLTAILSADVAGYSRLMGAGAGATAQWPAPWIEEWGSPHGIY